MSEGARRSTHWEPGLLITAGVVTNVVLGTQVLGACALYEWVDWEDIYGRPDAVAAFVHGWWRVIEGAVAVLALATVRWNRGLAFWTMALPQIIMVQAIMIPCLRAMSFSHARVFVNGSEVPSHANPKPRMEDTQNARE